MTNPPGEVYFLNQSYRYISVATQIPLDAELAPIRTVSLNIFNSMKEIKTSKMVTRDHKIDLF